MANRIKNVPLVMQMEATDGGAACLAMIYAYHGLWLPLEQVRTECGISRDGLKEENLLEAARNRGLEAERRTTSAQGLRGSASLPCIVSWHQGSYVVLTGLTNRHAFVNDPATGECRLTLDEFGKAFGGTIITFATTKGFELKGHRPDNLKFAISRLSGERPAVAFTMVCAAITSAATILTTSLGRVFMDRVLGGSNADWIGPMALIMLALAITWCVVSVLNTHFVKAIQGKIAVVSSSKFMNHLLRLPVEFYAQRTVGDLQQRQIANETVAVALVGQLAPVLINAALLVLYLTIMLDYSIPLTVIGVLSVVINAFMARFISAKRTNIARASAAIEGKLHATTLSGIEMVETIKAAGAESTFLTRWTGCQASSYELLADSTLLDEYLGTVPKAVTKLSNIAVLVMGIWLIVKGDLTPGALLAFTGFMTSFMTPVDQVIGLGQTIQEMTTDMERIDDVLSCPTDVLEDAEELPPCGDGDHSMKLRGQIDLTQLTFGYSRLEPPLVEDFDLHLAPGQWAALVGRSGCGKSTITRLVSGLYEPWDGSVELDGTPLPQIPLPILRGSLSVVDQDIMTFNDTVMNNLTLWDKSIEGSDVILACQDAGIHDVIAARKGGYQSPVLPRGRNFSGGQLQRMEIARALANDPSIIILDEATSALDSQTEADVIRRIRDRGITCIVVAHRLSTIRDCDEIVVLDHGKVVERGTHEELMAHGGAYRELVLND